MTYGKPITLTSKNVDIIIREAKNKLKKQVTNHPKCFTNQCQKIGGYYISDNCGGNFYCVDCAFGLLEKKNAVKAAI